MHSEHKDYKFEFMKDTDLHRVPGHVERISFRDGFGKNHTTLITDHVIAVTQSLKMGVEKY